MAPQVGLEPTTFRLTAERSAIELLRNVVWRRRNPVRGNVFSFFESGDFLLSRAVASQVPSAYGGLTSVFGMGTGGALQLLSPERLFGCECPRGWFGFRPARPACAFLAFRLPLFPRLVRLYSAFASLCRSSRFPMGYIRTLKTAQD